MNFITFIKTVQRIKKSVHVICMYANNTAYFQYLWWGKTKTIRNTTQCEQF